MTSEIRGDFHTITERVSLGVPSIVPHRLEQDTSQAEGREFESLLPPRELHRHVRNTRGAEYPRDECGGGGER